MNRSSRVRKPSATTRREKPPTLKSSKSVLGKRTLAEMESTSTTTTTTTTSSTSVSSSPSSPSMPSHVPKRRKTAKTKKSANRQHIQGIKNQKENTPSLLFPSLSPQTTRNPRPSLHTGHTATPPTPHHQNKNKQLLYVVVLSYGERRCYVKSPVIVENNQLV